MSLNWPPAPPAHSSGDDQAAQDGVPGPAVAGLSERQVPGPRRPYLPLGVQVRIGLTDPRRIGGVADITAMIASRLDDGASAAEMMSVIRGSARHWLDRQVRAGLLPRRLAWLAL